MKSPTYLLTAGCSYSQPNTINEPWPLHLDETLSSVEYISHTGHGAAGNQTISRKVISGVLDALEQGCGAEIPRWLKFKLEDYSDDLESLREFGVDFISELSETLIQYGVPSIHFYSLNYSKTLSKIVKNIS